jgi:serine/threonine-protein kinase
MELRPGQTFADQYEVIETIGEGAFSYVYRVHSASHARPLALKVSRTPMANNAIARRALREIHIQKSITSPHTPVVHEHGLRSDGVFYVVMDLLPGATLPSVHDFDSPMDPATAVRLVQQLCEPLDQLHQQGIIHRDIKPMNVFWEDEAQTAYLFDFGLARSWRDDKVHGMSATWGDEFVGTPHYSQPERLQEEVVLSPSADVYSLATLTYELLTGHTPFVADKPFSRVRQEWRTTPLRWLEAHARDPVIPLSRHVDAASLPRGVENAVLWAMAKDPRRRPQRASELATALGG